MSDQEKKSKRGGYREGAGRKTKYASTSTMRVPDDYKPIIKALIEHLDNTDMIGFDPKDHPVKTTIEDLFRSRQHKKQKISFITEPYV